MPFIERPFRLAVKAVEVLWGNIVGKPTKFPPEPHASTHAAGGDDPLSPQSIGAAPATHSHTAADIASGRFSLSRLPTGPSGHVLAGQGNAADPAWVPKVDAFDDLVDTPSTKAGQAGKFVRVNAQATALEYALPGWNDIQNKPGTYPPDTHASTHAVGGSDPLTPQSIGAAQASHTHQAGDIASGRLALARLPAGPSGYVLTGQGTDSDPAWAPPGATTFLSLTDTPSSYSGQAGKFVRVRSDETGLEFAAGGGGGGGASTFDDLTDTPSSKAGQAGKFVRVNAQATALEYALPGWNDIQNKPSQYTPSAHAFSHAPGGSDALPTAAPSGGLGTANQEGTSTAFARADHVHLAFDNQSPASVGTSASPGTATVAARRDHVHTLADGVVTAAKLADGAVITSKIADGAVTDAKISGRLSLSKLPTSDTANRVLGVTTANADPVFLQIVTAMLADGAVTDAKIGDRTITDASAPTGDTAQLTTLLSWLAYMIKTTTGATNWRTAPSITVNALANHKARHATGGADALSPADIGAVNKAGDTLTGILVAQNNTQYTTAQVRNIILSTSDPSGGGSGDVWMKYT